MGEGTKEQCGKKTRQRGEVWLTPVEAINDPLLLIRVLLDKVPLQPSNDLGKCQPGV